MTTRNRIPKEQFSDIVAKAKEFALEMPCFTYADMAQELGIPVAKVQNIIRASGIETRSMMAMRRNKELIALITKEPCQYTYAQLSKMFGMKESAVVEAISRNNKCMYVRSSVSPKRAIKAARRDWLRVKRERVMQSRREKKDVAYWPLDGFSAAMALAAKMPPPNFSGMSNTQSRAVG